MQIRWLSLSMLVVLGCLTMLPTAHSQGPLTPTASITATLSDGTLYTSVEGGFRVWMPGKLLNQSASLTANPRFIISAAGKNTFSVNYTDRAETIYPPAVYFISIRSGLEQQMAARATDVRSITLDTVTGVQFNLLNTTVGQDMQVTLFVTRTRMYFLTVSFVAGTYSQAEADAFVNSFTWLPDSTLTPTAAATVSSVHG